MDPNKGRLLHFADPNTGVACVMMSKRYAVAVGINLSTLVAGIEFVTADGALATSLGTTPSPIEFVLSRGTPQEFRFMLDASIPAYDILLGVLFIRAARGGYCSHTEKFTYRYFGADETLTSFSLLYRNNSLPV